MPVSSPTPCWSATRRPRSDDDLALARVVSQTVGRASLPAIAAERRTSGKPAWRGDALDRREGRVFVYRHRLPHLRSDGVVHFVTWRVRNGQADLSDDERDGIVMAIRHFNAVRYVLHAFVVMNDHVHVMVQMKPTHRLEDVLHSWKSFTANRMQRNTVREGAIWQDEYFDRVVRDDAEYEQKRHYILNNPYRRWPEIASYRWAWAIGLD